MADTKALFTQRFDAARTAMAEGDEPAAAASFHSAIVVARSDPGLRRELASALFHLGKLSRKFGRAGEAEAGPLLTEALTISEDLFGRDHAALAPLLNELSRLYVQRSQYARAEDALQRLLTIARGKGEENADVATALAGLAAVKRKLGDDAAAETLYRDALRIREAVLEPNHMVIVGTLEQLSATCAARGNSAEAVALLRRAVATREVVLGPGHATVLTAHSRIEELELQVAIEADTAAAMAARASRGSIATPAWFNRVPDAPGDTPSDAAPSPVAPRKQEFQPPLLRPAGSHARERSMTPTVTAAVAAASLMASSMQTPSASQIVIPPAESVAQESAAPLSDVALADLARVDVATDHAALDDRQSLIESVPADAPEPARKKRTVLYASSAAAAAAIVALLIMRPFGGSGGSDPVSSAKTPAQVAAPAPVVTLPTMTAVATTGAAAVVGAKSADSIRSASATPAPTAPATQPEKRASDSATRELRLPRVEVNLGTINIPNAPVANVQAPNMDSIVRAAERQRASDTNRAAPEKLSAPAPADVGTAVTPAKLIGRVPQPTFPEKLLRAGQRDGQVLVRFLVNEAGRVDVTSMIVERSDDELFTDAVRDILPLFRFEPARTHESKPVSTWVSVPFRFMTAKK